MRRRDSLVLLDELVLSDCVAEHADAFEEEDEKHGERDGFDDENEGVGETDGAEVTLFVGMRGVLVELVSELLGEGSPVEVVDETEEVEAEDEDLEIDGGGEVDGLELSEVARSRGDRSRVGVVGESTQASVSHSYMVV